MAQKYKNNNENPNSDHTAVQQCKDWLEKKEKYESVDIVHTPTDIVCQKNGRTIYVEVKMTKQEDYFGAATLTEWKKVFDQGADLLFVVAKKLIDKKRKGDDYPWDYEFYKIYPEEFYKISTIPPFKVNFNIEQKEFSVFGTPKVMEFVKRRRRHDTIELNNDKLRLLVYVYDALKDEKSIHDLLKYFNKRKKIKP